MRHRLASILPHRRRTAALLIAAAFAAALIGAVAPAPAPPARAAGLCGLKTGTSTVSKVMVIWMENKDYASIVGNSAAPFLNNTEIPPRGRTPPMRGGCPDGRAAGEP